MTEMTRAQLYEEFRKFVEGDESKLTTEPPGLEGLSMRVSKLTDEFGGKITELYQLNEAVCAREANRSDWFRKVQERLDKLEKSVGASQSREADMRKRLDTLEGYFGAGNALGRIGDIELRLEKKDGTNSYEAFRMAVNNRLLELERRNPDPKRGSALPSQPAPEVYGGGDGGWTVFTVGFFAGGIIGMGVMLILQVWK